MDSVLNSLPSFKATKSLIEEMLTEELFQEHGGHVVKFSAKFHAECAGHGIEYMIGRSKYYHKKFNRQTVESLRETTRASVAKENLPLHLIRKYARKCRDYMRVYRASVTGFDADPTVKLFKSHRSALDSHFAFIVADGAEE